MTKIYLVSSVQGEGELYRIVQGQHNTNLTDKGWQQVTALGDFFAHISVDKVYASDLYRGYKTVSNICSKKGLTAYQRKDLREACLGMWEGKSWGDIAYTESEQLRYFRTSLEKWSVQGAETPDQVLSRMLNAIRQIAIENTGSTIVIVAHIFAVKMLLANLQDIPLEKTPELPTVTNASIYTINYDSDKLHLVNNKVDISLYNIDYKRCSVTDFETDMYFYPLPWVEYGEIMAEAVEAVWKESGEDKPFNKNILLEDAAMFPTTIGFVNQEPAGFLQLGKETGWITLLCTHPACRNVGLGIQLVGQAVLATRLQGGDFLRIALPKCNPYKQFFTNCGFVSSGKTQQNREILEKDISFFPEALHGV